MQNRREVRRAQGSRSVGSRVIGTVAIYTKTWLSSGAGLFAQALAAGMADSGGDIVFVAPQAEADRWERPRRGLARIRSSRERRGGGRLRRAIASLARIASGWGAVLRARRRARRFVVTIPDPLVFALPLLALLRLTGARIIYVVHDPLPHSWKLSPRWRSVERGAYAAAYRLSHMLVVLSDSSATALRAAFPRVDRPIEVIEHGVFPLDTPPTAMPGNGELLLFGTLRRNKGIREAIEGIVMARAEGSTMRLVIAGAPDADDRSYWDACAALAAQHPAAVRLAVGYVEDAALERLIAACDAFLLPYQDFHSQSGVAILAASNARPLIAAAAGGIGDLIAEGLPAAEIARPVTARSVADAILAFGTTPVAEWNRRSLRYRDVMLERRAWPAIGSRYLALADRIVA